MKRSVIDNALTLIAGVGAGAAMMYLLEARSGRRRCAVMYDQAVRAVRGVGEAARKTGRRLKGRLRGAAAEARAAFHHEVVDDRVLCQRVRSEMGHHTGHAGAIAVGARDGFVTLRGCVMEREHKGLLKAVHGVRGVRGVEDRLERAGSEQAMVSLLNRWGEAVRRRVREARGDRPVMQRAAIGILGGTLGFYGAVRRDPVGMTMGILGLGLIARSACNLSARKLIGMRGSHRPSGPRESRAPRDGSMEGKATLEAREIAPA